MVGVRIRTGYSFRAAVGLLPQIMARLVECNYPVAPITDRASTFGFVRWAKLAGKNNLKPVFGVELAVTKDSTMREKKNSIDYWTFLAIDDISAVNKLVQLATSQFYFEPIISYQQAASAEGVFKIAGYRSDLSQFTRNADLYIGLAPSCSKGYIRDALDRGHQLAACSDNKWTSPTRDDQLLYETIIGREASLQSYDQHIQTKDEWFASVKHKVDRSVAEQAMVNSLAILEQSTAQLKKSMLLTPEKPMTLRAMCEEGAKKLGCDLTDPIYAARLDRELAMIEEKQFEDYFYILSDICQWARGRMAVGCARGSSAGSLVCYLLSITTIDPILHKLIFERFIDLTRKDLPDVDVDFSDKHREEVFEYMSNKFGKDRVARIGSVALYKGPSALNEAGAALKVPRWKCNAVSDSLLKRSGGDARALDTLEDTMKSMPAGQDLLRDHPEMNIVTKMEGHPRHHSMHAAGIVLTSEPLLNYAAVDQRTGTLHCDKKDAEELNLLKIDALGLTQLSTFEYALELAGLDRLALESVPLNDTAAFKLLNDAKFCGIFQFNGMALQSIVKQFTVSEFNDIVAITALARPGPLASGNAHEWVRRKNGVHQASYPHQILEPYLSGTLGIVLYQEQIMEIGKHIGDLSWEDVSELRKAMSKSLGVEFFNKYGDRWKAGAIAKGIDAAVAGKFWDEMCHYGSWCISGDTQIKLARRLNGGRKTLTIRELHQDFQNGKMKTLFSLYDDQRVRWQKLSSVSSNGFKECNTYSFSDGSTVTCTEDHQFLINGIWKPIKQSQVGDNFAISSEKGSRKHSRPRPGNHQSGEGTYRVAQEGFPEGENHPFWKNGSWYHFNQFRQQHKDDPCEDCSIKKPRMEAHHNDFNGGQDRPEDLSWLCCSCHHIRHRLNGDRLGKCERGLTTSSIKLIGVSYSGIVDTYDISMPTHHNFVLANDLITHNSFNLAHAVSYGLISYQCLWLKSHFPFEFAAATLTNESDPDKQIMMLREMVQEGYDYIPIDAAKSTDKWTVGEVNGKRVLIGPFTNIKGVGAKTIEKIIQARKDGRTLPVAVLKLVNESTNRLGSLFPIGDAFKRVLPNPAERGFKKPRPIKSIEILSSDYEVTVFCVLGKINPRDENEAVNVARRGGKILVNEPTASLNLQLTDDTDTIFGKISRWDYDRLGKAIVDRGQTGKLLYVITGKVKGGKQSAFRMMKIESVTYIGELVEKVAKAEVAEEEQDEQLSMF